MSKIIDIINEYENWLQERLSRTDGENIINVILLEKKGTKYKDFNNICNDIIVSLCYASKKVENGLETIYNNIPINDAFIAKLSYKIFIETNNQSKIRGGYATNSGIYNENDDKMYGCRFVFYIPDENYLKDNEGKFKETIWHEIQHAYVQYNVLKELNANSRITNIKMDNQQDIYHKFEDDNTLLDVVRNTFYYTNTNEINSHLNEMIPYLQEHGEINFTNYKNYLKDIPGYNTVEFLKKMLNNLTLMIETDVNNNFKIKFGQIIIDVYKKNQFYTNKKLTPLQCVNRTYRRVCNAVIYAENQFYKILKYTLGVLNRKKNFSEYQIVRKPIDAKEFDRQYKELLESLKIK